MIRIKLLLSLLTISLCLSSCGFHLRGSVNTPKWLSNVAVISSAADKQFAPLMESQLESYKIKVNPNPKTAKYWLIITQTNFQQQIISISASTNPRQYQLIMTVEFMLQARKGNIIKPLKQISVSRQLTVNNDRILGSNEEEATLTDEMRRDAIIQILNRLSRE